MAEETEEIIYNIVAQKDETTNVPTPGLNQLVTSIKNIARATLRAKLVAKVMTEIYGVENDLAAVNKDIKAENKKIAVAEFKLSRIEDEDPEKEDKTERYNNSVKEAEESLKYFQQRQESLTKQIAEKTAHIAEIEEGKVKVSAEELEELVNKLLVENAKKTVQNL